MKFVTNSLVTAHRGASGLAPENTLASLRKAMEIGADFAEIDVHLSKDEEFVLLHDDTLNRTTNGKGFVGDYPVSVLKKLDAGSWFSPFYKNESIPTLSEVIHTVQGRMKLNIEMKDDSMKTSTMKKFIKLVYDFNFSDQCIITSFNQKTIEHIHSFAPYLKIGLILNQQPSDRHFNNIFQLLAINYRFVNSDVMQQAVKTQKEIHAWTVNELDEMNRCISIGVHNIITNYPNRLKNVLVEYKTSPRS
jgi:glycerophosphoryl diester phosphodiesterase